ncbi:S-adenosyl-L-methionine-dependent methyltransferase [Bombardia bombarda]|uniref:S-adenosyl-L-methionine-dependent methyltransferase n=1 Tax=Bombardia bombarda TaxID=252184 RepID=A0AA40BWF5_9PEZI|nr:S-adenosyl-L-methionine-dependent methyltransferase [Bombardia bombarda]
MVSTNEAMSGMSGVRYLDTASAYDLWAEVYDTDANFLQALDTIEMRILLPRVLSKLKSPTPWRVVDLGCGTGRNTGHLLAAAPANTNIIALDLSPKMLDVARNRLSQLQESQGRITFQGFNILQPTASPQGVDAIISTLVVEHTPLSVYFPAVAGMLKKGGLLLLTNMHSDMGKISQAGFVDPKTGEKIRPQSYAHSIDDIMAEALANGLEAVDAFEERMVTEENYLSLGPRAKKWVGVKVWYGGILRKM